jgi:hypothetical protein
MEGGCDGKALRCGAGERPIKFLSAPLRGGAEFIQRLCVAHLPPWREEDEPAQASPFLSRGASERRRI